MKTLTKNSATKKLNKLTVKTPENQFRVLTKTSKAYEFAMQVINGAKTIRPCYTSGSGRHTTNQDYTQATKSVLDEIGIEFVLSNDSMRGGLTGNLITITTKIK